MDQNKMIEDLVAMLDSGMSKGVGHINADVRDDIICFVKDYFAQRSAGTVDYAELLKAVSTLKCVDSVSSDCSRTPLACSVPTLHQGLDDYN